jgi:hypothetical protein
MDTLPSGNRKRWTAREALPPRSDMALLIRAQRDLIPSKTRCSAHPTPAADFCRPVGVGSLHPQSRFRDKRQISRGKFDRLPHATAEFTTIALDGYGFRSPLPARPAPYASDPVLIHLLARVLHASFRPSVAGTPWSFAMTSPPSGCQGDFHPRAAEHARHTTKRPAELSPRAACTLELTAA